MLPDFFRTLPLRRIFWTNFGWHLQVNKNYIPIIISFVKIHGDCNYKVLVDIVAVDALLLRSIALARFSVKYILLSVCYQSRISLEVNLEQKARLYSTSNIFLRSGWAEREIWDLFGIYFVGHGDLRRILTDYGFRGHPLLKDFPISGYSEAIYREKSKRVTFRDVQLTQSSRRFFSDNSWGYF